MIAIKKVLVATDFSEQSTRALEYGRELARSYLADLHVLHVADDMQWRYSLDLSPELFAGIQADLEATARARLAALLSDEDRDQLHAQAAVRVSPMAADAIVHYANESGADIVVLGTHGRGGIRHFFLGSIAERVIRTAPCPVLTVRTDERDFIAPDALTRTSPS